MGQLMATLSFTSTPTAKRRIRGKSSRLSNPVQWWHSCDGVCCVSAVLASGLQSRRHFVSMPSSSRAVHPPPTTPRSRGSLDCARWSHDMSKRRYSSSAPASEHRSAGPHQDVSPRSDVSPALGRGIGGPRGTESGRVCRDW